MNVEYIEIKEKKIPIKWSARARSNWEKLTGVKWLDIGGLKDESGAYIKPPYTFSVEDTAIMCHEILREGHRKSDTSFDIELDQVFDWLDEYNLEGQITSKVFPQSGTEKKQSPSE